MNGMKNEIYDNFRNINKLVTLKTGSAAKLKDKKEFLFLSSIYAGTLSN